MIKQKKRIKKCTGYGYHYKRQREKGECSITHNHASTHQQELNVYGHSWIPMEYLNALFFQYNENFESEAKDAWLKTQLVIQRMAQSNDNVRVYIYNRDQAQYEKENICVDVNTTYRVNAYSNSYTMNWVTGANPFVQARIATQRATAEALLQAVLTVELQDPAQYRNVAFVCDGSIHCSLACGCLLVSLAYPKAAIILSGSSCIITDALDAHPYYFLS